MKGKVIKMYLNRLEYRIIKISYIDENSMMSEIIDNHHEYKKKELDQKLADGVVSILRYQILVKRLNRQYFVCKDSMKALLRTRANYYNEAVHDFENTIRIMDGIGSNITVNPFIALINPNKIKGDKYEYNIRAEYHVSCGRRDISICDVSMD